MIAVLKKHRWKTTLLKLILGILLLHLSTRLYTTTRYHHLLQISGELSLWLLLLTLACTPVARIFNIRPYRETRKYLGIFAFLFSLLHLASFLILHKFTIAPIVQTILEEPHMLLAVFGFLGLVPLAITSNRRSIRKLGRKWKTLHLSVYPVTILCVGHAWLVTPHNPSYVILLTLLLALRAVPWRKYRFFRANRLINRTSTKHRKPSLWTQLMIWGPLLILAIAMFSPDLKAEEKYYYDKDHSFFSTWFMPKEMATIRNQEVDQNCSNGCHWTILPGLLPKKAWEHQMDHLDDHYGVSLTIPESTSREIRDYLVGNAAETSRSKYSVKILDSLSGRLPMRFDEIPYIARKHDKIRPEVFQQPTVKNLLNCPACHIGVEKSGAFQEKFVELPR